MAGKSDYERVYDLEEKFPGRHGTWERIATYHLRENAEKQRRNLRRYSDRTVRVKSRMARRRGF